MGVEEKLPGGASDDKTMMGIGGRGSSFLGSGPPGLVVKKVFPDKLVGIGESIRVKIEGTHREEL